MLKDPRSRASLIQLAMSGGLCLIGLTAGTAPMEGLLLSAAGSLGTNLLAALVGKAQERWCNGWFTEQGLLNHDVAWAVYSALASATRQMEMDWRQDPTYKDLRQNEPDIAQNTLDSLEWLRKEAASLAQHPDRELARSHLVALTPEVVTRLQASPREARQYFDEEIRGFFRGLVEYHVELARPFVEYVEKRLPTAWLQRFEEVLKGTGENNTRAWRAYQMLWQQSLQAAVAQTQQGIAVTLEAWLKEWGQRLSSLPVTERDLTGERELSTALESVRKQLREIQDELAHHRARLDDIRQLARGRFIVPRDGDDVFEEIPFARRRRDDDLIDNVLLRATTGDAAFVGRDRDLQQLTGFIDSGGYLLVTAPAGGGKSTLLARWLRALQQQHNATQTCYHFFRRDMRESELYGGLACLSEQLLQVYGILGDVRESEPTRLRAIFNGLLGVDVSAGNSWRRLSHVVVVIDGLDEASDEQSPSAFAFPPLLFPQELGSGITVILAARTTEGEDTAARMRAQLNLPRLEQVPLPELDAAAVQDLLRQSSNVRLRAQADEPDFVRRFVEKTGGLAIYLRHLIEQLAHTDQRHWEQVMISVPPRFTDFVKQVARTVDDDRWRDALYFISLAKDPLSNDDLLALTKLSGNPLRPEDLDSVPWAAQRWLTQRHGHWAFQHPSIAEAYAETYGPLRSPFTQHLLDWCSRWQEHHSPYALRHYAAHLHEARKRPDLFALAQNAAYWAAQCKHLPDEPNTPFKTIQRALLDAAEVDDAGAIAALMLTHAWRLVEVTQEQETPLHALRGGHLQRAYELSDLFDIERWALWHLLLAWELQETGRQSEAHATLERLRTRSLPGLSHWQEDYAALLLFHVLPIDAEAFAALRGELLGDNGRAALDKHLITGGQVVGLARIGLVKYGGGEAEQASWAMERAMKKVATGDRAGARTSLVLAMAATEPIGWSRARAETQATIAAAQAAVGEVAQARTTLFAAQATVARATRPDEPWEWQWSAAAAKPAIAIAQARVGDMAGAHTTLAEILATVRQIRDPFARAELEVTIATAQAAVGEIDAALATAEQIEGPWGLEQAEALGAIAAAQATAGDTTGCQVTLAKALATVERIRPGERTEALAAISVVQAKLRDDGGARTTLAAALTAAKQIELPWELVVAQAAVAVAQEQAGDSAGARVTLASALTTTTQTGLPRGWQQAQALGAIAAAQAYVGFGEQAIQTAQAILTDRNVHIPAIASALADAGDQENFNRLLVPCAYHLDAAYTMCGLLARIYPKKATAIAAAVNRA